ncbi:DALR anticodon-binding domain-containing protein, partial [Streptomyces sp. NPDC006393]|uniref:DALR anticodon-binding domain-containing protein n=1 Tax=Streptomyces sp. NPDC006393 TaxID=3156763 RepID=UPI0033D30EF7
DSAGGFGRLVAEVLECGARFGHVEQGSGRSVQLHCPCDVRAVVVADVVARLFRAQGHDDVRIGCDGSPPPEWASLLGVRVEAFGPFGPFGPFDASGAQATIRPVPVPLSRCPEILALGRDAGRWALLHPAGHDRVQVDGRHLVQRESNPLFRVRYAHARTRALRRNAADLGFRPDPEVSASTDPTAVRPLLTALGDHPRVLAQAAAHRAPDRLARHLVTVADAVLPLLPAVLPLGEEKPSAAHRARLALAEAAGTVLAGGLSLLGIDAPDHL